MLKSQSLAKKMPPEGVAFSLARGDSNQDRNCRRQIHRPVRTLGDSSIFRTGAAAPIASRVLENRLLSTVSSV